MRNGLVEKELPVEIEELSHQVIGCAIEVHRELGPGLLEGIYEDAMVHECGLAGLRVERQIEIGVPYKGVVLRSQRIDLLINGLIIVEIKSVSELQQVHSAQVLSYLRIANRPLGFLFNFNDTLLRAGMRRLFNERWTPTSHILTTPSSPSRSSR